MVRLVLSESQQFLDTDAGGLCIPVVSCNYGERDMSTRATGSLPQSSMASERTVHPKKKKKKNTRWSGQRVTSHGNATCQEERERKGERGGVRGR